MRIPLKLVVVLVCQLSIAAATADTEMNPSVDAEVLKAGYHSVQYRVPMRDGTKLFTVVYAPTQQTHSYPILLMRTAYGTDAWIMNPMSQSVGPDNSFDRDGYIFVYQDLRGLGESEGVHEQGGVYKPLKRTSKDVDESSDAYDTIEWLVHHVPQNNGKVGIWGISAEGRTSVYALLQPHPALMAASPQAAPADFFIGDDVYHNGAFRPTYNYSFMLNNRRVDHDKAAKIDAQSFQSNPWSYDFFLRAGSLKDLDTKYLHGAAPVWLDIIKHDTYDEFWKFRNTPRYIRDIHIPVLNVGGWFDAEDFYGTLANYQAIDAQSVPGNNTLIIGPWNHGGWYYLPGDRYGDVQFGSKTAEFFREQIMRPFFRKYLKGEGDFTMPRVLAFNTGANLWRAFDSWPPKGVTRESLYIGAESGLLRTAAPGENNLSYDTYVSDPHKPVPFTTEIRKGMGGRWMVEDQRMISTRTDVLVYETAPLDDDLTIAGEISADLFVSSSGSDSDWITKVIDVYPDNAPNNPEEANKNADYQQKIQMGGYQMLLSAEIMRGKFRNGLESAQPMIVDTITPIHIALPSRLHTFKAGHRIMIQIQSTWFPLYDLNPQHFQHISNARREDFQSATEKVYRSANYPSRISFDVLDATALQSATYAPALSDSPLH